MTGVQTCALPISKVQTVETTWGNQILDLQSNKIDLAFAVNLTPERALMVDFATPILVHSFTAVTRKGFPKPATWQDLNKPEVRNSRSEEQTSELKSLMRISYAVLCLQKQN